MCKFTENQGKELKNKSCSWHKQKRKENLLVLPGNKVQHPLPITGPLLNHTPCHTGEPEEHSFACHHSSPAAVPGSVTHESSETAYSNCWAFTEKVHHIPSQLGLCRVGSIETGLFRRKRPESPPHPLLETERGARPKNVSGHSGVPRRLLEIQGFAEKECGGRRWFQQTQS